MIDSLMAALRALYRCTDVHVADGAVRGSGEAGEEAGIDLVACGRDAPNERNRGAV